MPSANRWLDVALLLRPLLQGASMRRVLPKVATVLALALVGSILAAAILLGLFYALYSALLLCAYTPLVALLLTLAAASITLGLVLLLLRRQLRQLPRSTLPSTERVTGMVDAFLDGLQGRD